MKNLFKWSAIIVGCLVVVIIAAMLLIPMFVDVKKYKPVLESKVAEATGRPFSIGDDLSLSLFPWAGVSLSDLRLGNPAGFTEKDFVTVKSFEVRIKLLPLLRKDIQVKRFVLNEPHVALVKSKNGRVNWEQPKVQSKDTAEQKEEKAPPGDTSGINLPISALTVGNLAINNGSALWIDHTSDTRKEISDINLALKDVSMERPVQLTFSAQMDKKPFALEGTIGPLGKGFQAETVPVDLSLKALKQLALRLVGSVENPITNPGVDMDIEITEFSPRKLVAELGQEFPVKTSDPNALSSVSLKAHVKADAKKVVLTKGVMNLDQSKLDFSATAADFSRPNLKFDLVLDQIDLDRYMAPKSEQPAQEKAPPPAGGKTDYTPLRRMILEGTAKIGKLTVSKANIQDVLVEINAKNGIINLDPLKLKMYQGNADGKASLNVVKDIPQSSLKLRVNNIQVQPLLKDVMGKDFLQGGTNADINLSMAGDDPDRIKKTLNGKGELRFNDGAIVGIDLAGMARNVGSAFGLVKKGAERPKTDFTELMMPFTIKNGVANTPGTSMKSPFIRINAAGTADLVKETLDFRVEPKAVTSIKGQGDETQRSGIMVPVLVSGTFTDPKFRPDLSSAAKEKIEEKILESKEVKKVLEKEELKSLGKPAKDALKGILGN